MTINTYSLQNADNYNKVLSSTLSDVFIKYVNLINEFIIQCCENLYVKNINYNRYIIKKGVETLSHVFKMLLLYSMNLELTYHHCHKSLFYYIEFIGQISGDNQNLLQLTLKDSTLFVYKKTIFDINNEIRNKFDMSFNEKTKMDVIMHLIKIYNELLYLLIEKHEFPRDNQVSLLNEMSHNVQKVTNTIVNLYTGNNDLNFLEQLKIIDCFVECIKNKQLENNNVFSLFDTFIKKLSHKSITLDLSFLEKIFKKLNSEKFNDLLLEEPNKKTINWLFLD